MKSLDELKEIREKAFKDIDVRNQKKGIRIVVGMATCGIAAGARVVLNTIISEVKERNIAGVEIAMTGCIGVCRMEPIVEIYSSGDEKTTYVNIDSQKSKRIVEEHILNGKIIKEFLIEKE